MNVIDIPFIDAAVVREELLRLRNRIGEMKALLRLAETQEITRQKAIQRVESEVSND